jgi:dihydrofolate reductase
MQIIAACDDNLGIGKNGKLPWKNRDDLKHFKYLTLGRKCVFGRKTAETLPTLPNRELYCFTSQTQDLFVTKNNVFKTVSAESLEIMKGQDVCICGGSELYKFAYSEALVDEMVITHIDGEYDCDTFLLPDILDLAMAYKEVKIDGGIITWYELF